MNNQDKIYQQLHNKLFSVKFINTFFSPIDFDYDKHSSFRPYELCTFHTDVYNCAVDFLHGNVISPRLLDLVVDELISHKSLYFRNFINFYSSKFYYFELNENQRTCL